MTTTPTSDPTALDDFREDRTYLGADHRRNERRTWLVTAICFGTLAVVVAGGIVTDSMALIGAGLHMAAHVTSLVVAAGAYAFARRNAANPAFSFGAGKVGYLAGFANALVLGATAALIAWESVHRIIDPHEVHYHGALPIALGWLVVTVVCAWLLRPTRAEAARHDPDGDLNIHSAHLHLTADAAVGVLALGAVFVGSLGFHFADPLAGLAGAALVAHFAWRLARRAGAALLDINPAPELTAEVRRRLSAEGEAVVDLHLWRLGPGHHAVIAVVESTRTARELRGRLSGLAGLSHVTIETRTQGDHDHHGRRHA
jgi:cation diffusion facilitator family transporter